MNVAAREIEQIARLQHAVDDRLADLGLLEVAAREARQLRARVQRRVHAPALAALQLQDERLDVVVVGREALGARRRQVHVGAHARGEQLLQCRQVLPAVLGVGLRVEQADREALLEKVPHS